ncbi:MFS transporter [Glycomyces harbinensis]|uniref:Predicted arabinose efflux permease, MFS family n=1 Tax=Glycomyces harbinensis TaxID=58114 RepID=A0A1G6ZL98_9ACTN|nr:MFS transporter [Glycomyces harbinensis]SDE03271.1 Predicted arabinose efflux permease, MFS family [Glycomyces harbinensis]
MTATRRAGRDLLALPGFRRWYAARTTSLVGTAASGVAVPMLVWERTGSATATAAASGLSLAPYLLFGLFAGAYADRVDRRRLMVGADAAAAALLATVPSAAAFGTVTAAHVLAVVVLTGTAFVWFDAAAFGALPQIVGRERLQQANSLIFSTTTVVGIAAPALGGLLASAVGPEAVIGINALTFAASALLLRRLALPGRAAAKAASIRADIAEGLRFIWSEPRIRALTFAGFGIACTGGGALGLIVVHADVLLDVRDWELGLLYSATAVGSLFGAMLLGRFTARFGHGPVSIAAYLLELTMVVALAAAGPGPAGFALAVAAWIAWDFAHTAAVVNGITVRQLLTPDALQGRVNTTGRMIAWGGAPVGALAAGGLADLVGVQNAFLLLSVPVAAGTILLLVSPVRRLKTIES